MKLTYPTIQSAEKRRLRWPRPTILLASGFAVGSVGGGVLYFVTADNELRAWLPNVSTAFATLAVTVTAVQWIVDREARLRLKPRIDSITSQVRAVLAEIGSFLAVDYAVTHVSSFRPIPNDFEALLKQWLDDCDAQDACWVDAGESWGVTSVLDERERVEERLKLLLERNREVMEPALVRAIDDFLTVLETARRNARVAKLKRPGDSGEQAEQFREAERQVVIHAQHLAEVLARLDRRGPIEIDDLVLAYTRDIRNALLSPLQHHIRQRKAETHRNDDEAALAERVAFARYMVSAWEVLKGDRSRDEGK